MRVRVKVHGHQCYNLIEGEVLYWGSVVERYDDKPLQVPAVILNCGKTIEVIPLQSQLRWTEVEILADSTPNTLASE
jgi:hypothetical protein